MRRVRAWLNDLSFTDRVAVGLVLVLIPSFAFPEDEPAAGIDPRSFDAGAVLLLVAAFLALLARKRFPGTTVLVVITLTGTWYLSGYTNGGINIAALIAFFHLGMTGDRRRQFGVGAVALAMPVIAIAVFTDSPFRQSIDAIGYPLAALLFGEIVRSRRLLLDEYAAKARAAQLGAEAEAERRVTSERLHIAQDVHDVLAHTVSVMTVQAAAGADALDREPADPAGARKALADIRTAGKDAMAELRATVAVLRGSGGGGGSGGGAGAEQPELAPAPGLERLPELVDGARAKGLEVELTGDAGAGADGESEGIESLVQLAVYRVVQESLTNVIRHAGASRAAVRVERRPTRLLVTVTDDGASGNGAAVAAPGRATVGFGLRGMRERVESLGGSLQFGDVDLDEATALAADITAVRDDFRLPPGIEIELFVEESEFSSEGIGFVAAMVILLVAFGSVLATGLPLVTALFGIVCGLMIVNLAAHLFDIPDFAPPAVAMVGIGVGIDYAFVQVFPTTAPQDEATSDLVHRLRDELAPAVTAGTGAEVLVGGAPAAVVDFADFQMRYLPFFIGAVLVLSFLLLMAVFRSLLVPLKAVIMNLLSIGAAYGVVVAVFQRVWLTDALGLGEAGPIEAWAPMMLFAIVFGLSMDYEVFLLSRIKEEYGHTGDNATAVADGLARTARLITAAAAIMICVFAGFMLSADRALQLFGMGLAVAVLVDATLVRLVLVPATMELLGDRNWWMPRWLDCIVPRIDVEAADPDPEPATQPA